MLCCKKSDVSCIRSMADCGPNLCACNALVQRLSSLAYLPDSGVRFIVQMYDLHISKI